MLDLGKSNVTKWLSKPIKLFPGCSEAFDKLLPDISRLWFWKMVYFSLLFLTIDLFDTVGVAATFKCFGQKNVHTPFGFGYRNIACR